MSMKNPLTPVGIEPATFRFVAQHLNNWATEVPEFYEDILKKNVCDQSRQSDFPLYDHTNCFAER